MRLYDEKLREISSLLAGRTPRVWEYEPAAAWRDAGISELVLQRDEAFELGGGGKPAVTLTCFTSDKTLLPDDRVLLYGPELKEIKGDRPFARLALLRVGELDEDDEKKHTALQSIEFVKYRVHPEGYMVRTSGESHREQVRVSREAVRRGISFRRVGSAYIAGYRKNPAVLAAQVVFITDPAADFAALEKLAKDCAGITNALSHILEGLPTDCASCTLKPVCDEVEGMKELHFKGKQ